MKPRPLYCLLLSAILPSAVLGVGDETAVPPSRPLVVNPAVLRRSLNHLEKLRVPRPDDAARVKHWANFHSAIANVRCILDRYEYATSTITSMAVRDLDSALYAYRCLNARAANKIRPGIRCEGYFAENDGSFQPFLRYVPPVAAKGARMPLVVFMHGYFPSMNRVNWQYIPDTLRDFAETNGFLVAAPFGRSNTDFQGIGEQDVLRVIREMEARYRVDSSRIFLSGISMGGMGVWTIGAHHPQRFAGLIPISGRADYYFWQQVARHDQPSYKRELIDGEFGHPLMSALKETPVFCLHGATDLLISVDEARHAVAVAKRRGLDITYREFPESGHWIFEKSFEQAELQVWMKQKKRVPPATRPAGDSVPTLGRIRRTFLERFSFVSASPGVVSDSDTRFLDAVQDWTEFAKSPPRQLDEATATPAQLAAGHVFLFGEPEESAAVRRALEGVPVGVTSNQFVVGAHRFDRREHGLYVACPSPWSRERTAVVQCGSAWGTGLSFNHKYDLLPDFIVYSRDTDPDGSNTALCAGFFDDEWKIDTRRLYLKPPAAAGDEP